MRALEFITGDVILSSVIIKYTNQGRLKAICGYFASDTEYSFENFLTDYHSHSQHSPQRGWSILDGVPTRKPLVYRISNTLYVAFLDSIALKCLLINEENLLRF